MRCRGVGVDDQIEPHVVFDIIHIMRHMRRPEKAQFELVSYNIEGLSRRLLRLYFKQ